MATDEEIKLAFLYDELNRYGYKLKSLMIDTIDLKALYGDRNKNEAQAHLKNRIGFKVLRDGKEGVKIQFFFADYGRLVEINYFRRKSRGKETFAPIDIDALVSGKRAKKKAKRYKDTRWYNITVWGTLNDLIGRVMYGLTEETRKSLIEKFLQNA